MGANAQPFVNGRYSRHLPTRLRERYEEAIQDTELLSLRDDLALLDSRLVEVLARVDQGESGARWRHVEAAWADFARHRAQGDVAAMQAALGQVEHAIRAGVTDYAAWQDIRSLLDQRARLVDNERKRLQELHQMITVERAMALISALQAAVQKYVHDPATLNALSAEFLRLTAPPTR